MHARKGSILYRVPERLCCRMIWVPHSFSRMITCPWGSDLGPDPDPDHERKTHLSLWNISLSKFSWSIRFWKRVRIFWKRIKRQLFRIRSLLTRTITDTRKLVFPWISSQLHSKGIHLFALFTSYGSSSFHGLVFLKILLTSWPLVFQPGATSASCAGQMLPNQRTC